MTFYIGCGIIKSRKGNRWIHLRWHLAWQTNLIPDLIYERGILRWTKLNRSIQTTSWKEYSDEPLIVFTTLRLYAERKRVRWNLRIHSTIHLRLVARAERDFLGRRAAQGSVWPIGCGTSPNMAFSRHKVSARKLRRWSLTALSVYIYHPISFYLTFQQAGDWLLRAV